MLAGILRRISISVREVRVREGAGERFLPRASVTVGIATLDGRLERFVRMLLEVMPAACRWPSSRVSAPPPG
jgi:hypothetical protein